MRKPAITSRWGLQLTVKPAQLRARESRPSATTTSRALIVSAFPSSACTWTRGAAPGARSTARTPRRTTAPASAAARSKVSCIAGWWKVSSPARAGVVAMRSRSVTPGVPTALPPMRWLFQGAGCAPTGILGLRLQGEEHHIWCGLREASRKCV